MRLAQGGPTPRPSSATTRWRWPGAGQADGRARGCTSSISTARSRRAAPDRARARDHRGACAIPVEVGGGLRDGGGRRGACSTPGARWAIVGTARCARPRVPRPRSAARFGDRIIVGDRRLRRPRRGRRAGRASPTSTRSRWRATRAAAGRRGLIYTDIARDGTETGPEPRSTDGRRPRGGHPRHRLGRRRLARRHPAARDGARRRPASIVGRALYTGAVDLPAPRSPRSARRPMLCQARSSPAST